MESGIGRSGYLGLAFACFGLGALGIGITYLAFTQVAELFAYLGLALAGAGLLGLFLFAAAMAWDRTPRPPADTRTAIPEAAPEPKPAKDVEFEYGDFAPAAPAAPEELIVPAAFQERAAPSKDPAQWPERRGKSDWSARMAQEARVKEMVEDSPVRKEMTARYTATTPMVRSIMTESEATLRVAERAPPDVKPGMAAPGMSVGRCGRCMTVLLAPDERPLRLKCPQCAKVTLLE